MDERHLVLVGPMGSGKSAVGRVLALTLGRDLVDIDETVGATAGLTIAEIFEREGEAAFRTRESAALDRALQGAPAVISTGGGIVLADPNRAALGAGRATVVWLDAELDTLVSRVGDGVGRPLLDGDVRGNLSAIVADRAALYESVADHRVDTTLLGTDAVVSRIMAVLGHEVPT